MQNACLNAINAYLFRVGIFFYLFVYIHPYKLVFLLVLSQSQKSASRQMLLFWIELAYSSVTVMLYVRTLQATP